MKYENGRETTFGYFVFKELSREKQIKDITNQPILPATTLYWTNH